MQTKWLKGVIPLVLLAGCFGAPDVGQDVADDEGPTAEATLAATIYSANITAEESTNWPKTITWTLDKYAPSSVSHASHSAFSWKVSWSTSEVGTTINRVSHQTSVEKCNLAAMIVRDYVGTGQPFHTGDIANPKYYSVFDHRPTFTLSASPALSVQVNQSVSLTAPSPHCQRHCDGAGTLKWLQKNANGSWSELTGAGNACTLTVPGSPTPGTESFKLVSTHQGIDSTSNEVTITWASCPSGQTLCSGQCVNLSTDVCHCGECDNSCIGMGCSNGTCSCFAAGTSITMADGSEKPIEQVAVGDWVLGYDTKGETAVPARVSHTFVHPDTKESLLLNGSVRVTAEHPFYVNGSWVEAGKLQPGDQLQRLVTSQSTPNPMRMVVDDIRRVPGTLTTYNLEVENVHDYFADGYLVHNKPVGCNNPASTPEDE